MNNKHLIDCPTCKGSGELGDYVIVTCYQCDGLGKIDPKTHMWRFPPT